MAKTIQVRNVPDETHRRLKELAKVEGVSLSQLVRRELKVMAVKLSFEELAALRRAHPGEPSKVKSENILRYIHEARGDL